MKNNFKRICFLIFGLFSLAYSNILGQSPPSSHSFRVLYQFEVNTAVLKPMITDSTVPEQLRKMIPSFIEAMEESNRMDIYNLDFNAGLSAFYFGTTLQIQSYKYDLSSNVNTGVIYKIHETGELLQIDTVQANGIAYKAHFSTKEDWKIDYENDTTITGYTCYYAEFLKEPESNIHAWFTPSIPINEGPATYVGLPGLILKVKGKTFSYLASHVSQLVFIDPISIPKYSKTLSLEEYEKLLSGPIRQ